MNITWQPCSSITSLLSNFTYHSIFTKISVQASLLAQRIFLLAFPALCHQQPLKLLQQKKNPKVRFQINPNNYLEEGFFFDSRKLNSSSALTNRAFTPFRNHPSGLFYVKKKKKNSPIIMMYCTSPSFHVGKIRYPFFWLLIFWRCAITVDAIDYVYPTANGDFLLFCGRGWGGGVGARKKKKIRLY